MSHTVGIIGAGYGGAALAKEFEDHAEVVLIDPRDAFSRRTPGACGFEPLRDALTFA